MTFIRLTLLALVFTLAACSSTGGQAPASAKDAPSVAQQDDAEVDRRMRCKRYKPIGSNRTQLVCNTPEQEEEEARRTQDAVRRVQSTTPRPRSDGGG